jgi:hypothetical protein
MGMHPQAFTQFTHAAPTSHLQVASQWQMRKSITAADRDGHIQPAGDEGRRQGVGSVMDRRLRAAAEPMERRIV